MTGPILLIATGAVLLAAGSCRPLRRRRVANVGVMVLSLLVAGAGALGFAQHVIR